MNTVIVLGPMKTCCYYWIQNTLHRYTNTKKFIHKMCIKTAPNVTEEVYTKNNTRRKKMIGSERNVVFSLFCCCFNSNIININFSSTFEKTKVDRRKCMRRCTIFVNLYLSTTDQWKRIENNSMK